MLSSPRRSQSVKACQIMKYYTATITFRRHILGTLRASAGQCCIWFIKSYCQLLAIWLEGMVLYGIDIQCSKSKLNKIGQGKWGTTI